MFNRKKKNDFVEKQESIRVSKGSFNWLEVDYCTKIEFFYIYQPINDWHKLIGIEKEIQIELQCDCKRFLTYRSDMKENEALFFCKRCEQKHVFGFLRPDDVFLKKIREVKNEHKEKFKKQS